MNRHKEMKNTESTGNEKLTKQDFNNLVESLFERIRTGISKLMNEQYKVKFKTW